MDGSLVDVSGCRHWVIPDHPLNTTGKKNFDKFHEEAAKAEPILETLDAINEFEWDYYSTYAKFPRRIIVTARAAKHRISTMEWLDRLAHHSMAGFSYDMLVMRPLDDYRPDYEVKKDILAHIRGQGYEPIWAVDDNPNVIALWEEEGIPTHLVPGWMAGQ